MAVIHQKKQAGIYYDKGGAWRNVKHPDFGAKGDSTTDEFTIGAFQAAHDDLPSTGGVLYVPEGTYYLDGTGASIASPKVLCMITKPNVQVVCARGVTFHMANWDQGDAATAGTDSTSQDCFKAFSFRDGVVGGLFYGGYFLGDTDGTVLNTGPLPRAVAISIDGASDIDVKFVKGFGIVGNLVNARGDNAGAGTPSRCERIRVFACRAKSCAENGFNFMGGTYDCKISECWGISNLAAGFESGTREGLTCHHNHFLSNKNGISQVGRQGVFTGNILRLNTVSGLNFQYQDASFDGAHNVVSGGIISENLQVGVLGDPGTNNNAIGGTVRIYDNGTGTGEGIKLAATCTRYSIDPSCQVYDSGAGKQKYGIHAITASNLSIKGVTTWGNLTNGLLVESASDTVKLIGNDFSDAVSVATTTTNVTARANKGYATKSFVTATVPSGSTNVTVNHNLATGAVTVLGGTTKNVRITPTNSMGSATKFQCLSLTATQVQVGVNVDPGATTATFGVSVDLES